MSRIIAIDPGSEWSAWCRYDSDAMSPSDFGFDTNSDVAQFIESLGQRDEADVLAVEMIASYGMPVGAEVFETCVWIGRFIESWRAGVAHWQFERGLDQNLENWAKVYRRDVKLHLCGQARAKDGNVRQALIDRWGGKAVALGNKAKPGPLYGFKADTWQALAVAVTYSDTQSQTCVSDEPTHSQAVS